MRKNILIEKLIMNIHICIKFLVHRISQIQYDIIRITRISNGQNPVMRRSLTIYDNLCSYTARRIAITPVEQTTQVGPYRSFLTPTSCKAQ